ncbi:hypothetical protein VTL71DRAFT_5858 [Oculimacula yallundae]|uniref:Uncharacterized protein n=1 Tax=Oculimacula yallundae TaxID=86028 RepID=A0ABR4BYQ4_9HELO
MLSSRTLTGLLVEPQPTLSIAITPSSKWLQPELSVGDPCASMGFLKQYRCWIVKDKSPAYVVWKVVSKAIVSLLQDQFEHLDAGDSDLLFEMFMIGRKPTSSVPTILFSCEKKSCRQNAMALVQKKSMLASYPGVKMAQCSKMPKILAQGEESEPIFLPPGVYLNGPLRSCGTSVLISSELGIPPRIATIGGVVFIAGGMFGVTAGHAFRPVTEVEEDDDKDDEFSFFGESDPFDSSDDGDELVKMTSQASISSGSSQSQYTDAPDFVTARRKYPTSRLTSGPTSESFFTAQKDKITESTPERYGTLYALSNLDEGHDWALVKIEHSTLLTFPRADEYTANNFKLGSRIVHPNSIATGSLDTEVILCTGSEGVVRGKLSSMPAFQRPAGQKMFRQLLTVSLNKGYFRDGDCGSWVCDLRTGAVYGHIVSSYLETGSAYLIPSHQIFKDMEKCLGKPVQLLTRTLLARNAAFAIWGHIDEVSASSFGSNEREIWENRSVPANVELQSSPRHDTKLTHSEHSSSKSLSNAEARLGLAPKTVEGRENERDAKKSKYSESRRSPKLPWKPITSTARDKSLDTSGEPEDVKLPSISHSSSFDLGYTPDNEISRRRPNDIPQYRQAILSSSNSLTKKDELFKTFSYPAVHAEISRSSFTAGGREMAAPESMKTRLKADKREEKQPNQGIIASASPRAEKKKSTSSSTTTKDPTKSKSSPSNHVHKSSSTTKRPAKRVVQGKIERSASSQIGTPLPERPVHSFEPRVTYPYASYTGYSPTLSFTPASSVSSYGEIPQPYPNQPSNLMPRRPEFGRTMDIQQLPVISHTQLFSHDSVITARPPRVFESSFQSPPIAQRFDPPYQDRERANIQANPITADSRAPPNAISPLAQQNRYFMSRPSPSADFRENWDHLALRFTPSRTELSDRQAMPPPTVRPLTPHPQARPYMERPSGSSYSRPAVSYNTSRNTETVSFEPATSNVGGYRNQLSYAEAAKGVQTSYSEKIQRATSYQEVIGGPFSSPLTVESLTRSQRRGPPSSRDTRSTRSSRRTRSRSRSVSSKSSATSKDENVSELTVTAGAGATIVIDNVNGKNVNTKVTGGQARVTFGGGQIDYQDGAEIEILKHGKATYDPAYDGTKRAENRPKHESSTSNNPRRRSENSTSTQTPADERSSLPRVSGTSEKTVVKGNLDSSRVEPVPMPPGPYYGPSNPYGGR